MVLNFNYWEDIMIEKKIIETFLKLLDDLSAKDAIRTLDYWIFIKYSNEFDKLNEKEQNEVRSVMHSLKLIHI